MTSNESRPLIGGNQARLKESKPWTTYIPSGAVVCTITFLWGAFVYSELVPQINAHKGTGVAETVIFHVFLACFLFNYFATMFKCPGHVPQDDPEWKFAYNSRGEIMAEGAGSHNHEMKADGDRRRCKWCVRYKPDRTHHCRICKTCVLKMDHHCPWVNNCVGAHNHKNFVLTTFYGFSCCLIIIVTASVRLVEDDRRESLNQKMEFGFLVTCLILSIALFLPLIALYGFHIWLALKGMSTIEFCEKRSFGAKYRSRYYAGPWKNLQAVLGDNPLSWFCCFGYPSSDGMHFSTAKSRMKVDLTHSKPTTANRFTDKLGQNSAKSKDPELDRGSGAGSAGTPSSSANHTSDSEAVVHSPART